MAAEATAVAAQGTSTEGAIDFTSGLTLAHLRRDREEQPIYQQAATVERWRARIEEICSRWDPGVDVDVEAALKS